MQYCNKSAQRLCVKFISKKFSRLKICVKSSERTLLVISYLKCTMFGVLVDLNFEITRVMSIYTTYYLVYTSFKGLSNVFHDVAYFQ